MRTQLRQLHRDSIAQEEIRDFLAELHRGNGLQRLQQVREEKPRGRGMVRALLRQVREAIEAGINDSGDEDHLSK